MQRLICCLAITAFFFAGSSVTAEENTTWGDVKKETGITDAPAAKILHIATAQALYWDDNEVVGWDAKMARFKDGVFIKMFAPTGPDPLDIKPGYVYTLWVPIFDNPEHCVDGCGADEQGFVDGNINDAVDPSVVGPVSSGIAGVDGVHLSGLLKRGQVYSEVPVGPDEGGYSTDQKLDNPETAEIHFIIQCHGPAIPGLVYEQKNYLHGGCNTPPPLDPANGGPNTCEDIQHGVFIDD